MGDLDDSHRRRRDDACPHDRWWLRQLWVWWWLWKVDSARRRRCIAALRALAGIVCFWIVRLLAWLVERECPGSRPPGSGDPRER